MISAEGINSSLTVLSRDEGSDFLLEGPVTPQFLTSSPWQRKDTEMSESVSSLTGGKLEVVRLLVWPTLIGRANNGGCD